jgi:hypothetical protein
MSKIKFNEALSAVVYTKDSWDYVTTCHRYYRQDLQVEIKHCSSVSNQFGLSTTGVMLSVMTCHYDDISLARVIAVLNNSSLTEFYDSFASVDLEDKTYVVYFMSDFIKKIVKQVKGS